MTEGLQVPIIRLELQAAKMTLLRALDDRNGELQAMVSAAMDRALPHIQAQIDQQMEAAVRDAVAQALREAAETAVEKVSADLVSVLGGKLEAALRKRIA